MNYLGSKLLFGLCLLNLLLFISCSKEEEVTHPPTINWMSPQENSKFNALDTAYLELTVNDDEPIQLIKITLKNELNVPVIRLDDIRPNSNEYMIETEFVLSDATLNGRYYFEVVASNATGTSASFRYVDIHGIDKNLSEIYVIKSNAQSTEIYELRSDSLFLLKQLVGDFLSSTIDPLNSLLFTSGKYNGDINAVNVTDSVVQWNYNSIVLPQTVFVNEFSTIKDNVLLASLQNGWLFGYQSNGIEIYSFSFESGFKPGRALYHDNRYVIFERIDKASGASRLVVQHFPSALAKSNIVFSYGRILDIIEISSNEAILFSNKGNVQYILNYNLDTDHITVLEELNKGPISSVEKLNEAFVAFNMGGDLYTFDYNRFSLSLIGSGLNPKVIRYNKVDGTIYCLNEVGIVELDTQGNLLNTVSTRSQLESMELNFK